MRNAFSNMCGMSFESKGDDNSRQGFVLTSIRYGLNSSSNMKSNPNIYTIHYKQKVSFKITSKVLRRFLGSTFP